MNAVMKKMIRTMALFFFEARRRLIMSVIVGGILAGSGAPVFAQLTVDQAVAKVQRELGGRVLSADSESRDGQVQYRIKVLLPDGRVRIVYVDAATGRVN